eukprot:TRINITY_DN31284_c0_g1_i1.p1 TRINITY_DN31284_c0_g1~~TRINITY_DN31284_c0_g1_i1.p1  ORF type:complete len:368 (+),score=60.76 TRINITY_DN31284_c0_g1_i1:25-1104(+)
MDCERAPDVLDIIVRQLAGAELHLSIPTDATVQQLRDMIGDAAALGSLDFKLCLDSGQDVSCPRDCNAVDELGLQNESVLLLVTDRARDYSRIVEPERVIKTCSYPSSVFIKDTGELLVTHYFGELCICNAQYELVNMVKLPFGRPRQLLHAASGELLVVFASKIGVFDSKFALMRTLGDEGLIITNGRGLAMALDTVFVSDAGNSVIHVFSFSSGELVKSISPCFEGKQISEPCGLTIIDDKLAIADRRNNRILFVSVERLEADSQLPQQDDVPESVLSLPNDVKVDSAGNILVMDTGNERLAVYRNDRFVTDVLKGFFKNRGQTYSNIGVNDITGAVAATNDDGHCITVMSPLFDAE